MEELSKQLGEVLRILKDADETVGITMYKMDPTFNEDKMHMVDEDKVLTKKHQFPTSVTRMGKYLFRGKQGKKQG